MYGECPSPVSGRPGGRTAQRQNPSHRRRNGSPGDLLPQFHHPTIAFREVVGEGHARIGEKAHYILFADTQAQQQIMTDPPRLPARALPLPRHESAGLCLMERQAVGEDRVETSLDQHDETRPHGYALLAREVGRMAGAPQQTLHLARPVLSLDLDQRLQFAQVVALHSACSTPFIV